MSHVMDSGIAVSIVIPAKNEAEYIERTVSAARDACRAAALSVQIIVVDNCSADATVSVAKTVADAVVSVDSRTVGALRNAGVRHSNGNVLLFLDADIELTDQWSRHIQDSLLDMDTHACISGSFVKPPMATGNRLATWFAHLNETNKNYLGSAHMLMKKEHFMALGGFDETLVSGEDSDLCRRAQLLGLSIVNRTDLLAYHHGFPSTISAFFLREWWHGSGDRGWSRVKGLAIVFMLLHVASVYCLVAGRHVLAVTGVLLVAALCIFASAVKFARQSAFTKLKNALIFYIYFCGRSMSILLPRSRTDHRQT